MMTQTGIERFSQVLDRAVFTREGLSVASSPDWMMGKTQAGGLSAALCVKAALHKVAPNRRLRSAQFVFIGPANGQLRVTAEAMRTGKTVDIIGADLLGNDGLAVRAVLTFASGHIDRLSVPGRTMPTAPAPDECGPFEPPSASAFKRQTESRSIAGGTPRSGSAQGSYTIWIRHTDPIAGEGILPMIALADLPPPPIETMFGGPAKLATISWHIDVLCVPEKGGWFLVDANVEHAANGFSWHRSTMWNENGVLVSESRQSCAFDDLGARPLR